uniref:uncharacterized protein LOC108950662 n=1 Tax=Ciona intestinalis TaxID=7719 RepID=UPI00089DBD4C|nr:uncharacterized protein LOC108950662 [Ciona intestinalis]|eukprot:XP_018672245.1 uncharacterized protein LOC108950662 [Ciona intestinalis]
METCKQRKPLLKPKHRLNETSKMNRRSCMLDVLPPINKHHTTAGNSRQHNLTNKKKGLPLSKDATVLFNTDLSEYIKRPSYFCHPVVIPTTKANNQRQESGSMTSQSLHSETSSSAAMNENVTGPTTCTQKQPSQNNSNCKSKATSTGSSLNKWFRVSKNFVSFCEAEGYNLKSPLNIRVTSSLSGPKKFGRIAAKRTLSAIPEDEALPENFRRNGKETDKNHIAFIKRKKAKEKRSVIKDAARCSAAKGQVASSIALSYILKQPERNSKQSLPPLRKIPLLTSFDNVWEPSSSLVTRR